ncbi:MAG: family 20 glycosylhydrolase [Phycisphaeraceae bacterium]|nr:family 20 glycosylhydrolase [Phycisphaeraceae bacterium]
MTYVRNGISEIEAVDDPSTNTTVLAVHLDLKGLPPTPARLLELLDVFVVAGFNAVLVEWEDAFPWSFDRRMRSLTAYTPATVCEFVKRAESLGIELIPLVQCLGHVETLLSARVDPELREEPTRNDVLNVLSPDARPLIESMVEDVLTLMPGVKRFHLGGDEAWTFASNPQTSAYAREHGKDALYLQHVEPILNMLAKRDIRPLLWHDMMIDWGESKLRKLASMADLVVWGYEGHPDQVEHHFNTQYIARFARLGLPLWGAGCYKGAEGMDEDVPTPEPRLANAQAWRELDGRFGFRGLIATGWSRYSTHRMQVEPIDAALAVLVRVGRLWRDGHDPGGTQALEILDSIGERSWYEARAALMIQLKALRRSAWQELRIVEGLAALVQVDPSRCGSGTYVTHINQFAGILQQLHDISAKIREVFTEVVDDCWLQEYLTVRLQPLNDSLSRLRLLTIP